MTPEESKALVSSALADVLAGKELSDQTIYALADIGDEDGINALISAACEVTRKYVCNNFDSCSIVNARSGLCPENCKWCAQSRHYATGCATYDIVDPDEALDICRHNAAGGIRRFSLVASGRAVHGKALAEMCDILARAKAETGISTCASLGLLNRQELQLLKDSGASRYHCNLETAPSHFATLCTTHTIDDKLATIDAARSVGLDICSGGIIGMGETRRQRAEFALTLRRAKPVSIPLNILCPIAGTPLENAEPISEREILITVALFRMAHPAVELRWAGGRERLSRQCLIDCMHAGINGGITGDLLTTTGATIASDKALVAEAGYKF